MQRHALYPRSGKQRCTTALNAATQCTPTFLVVITNRPIYIDFVLFYKRTNAAIPVGESDEAT